MKKHSIADSFILELLRNKRKEAICAYVLNMEIPGFEGIEIHKIEKIEDRIALYVMMPKKEHQCPHCGGKTSKIYDSRIQKS